MQWARCFSSSVKLKIGKGGDWTIFLVCVTTGTRLLLFVSRQPFKLPHLFPFVDILCIRCPGIEALQGSRQLRYPVGMGDTLKSKIEFAR